MKRIFLIRHGKADVFSADINDFNRRLKESGKLETELLGNTLFSMGFCPDLIISSPAKRAVKTAKILGEKTKCTNFLLNLAIYDGSYDRDWLVLDIENKCPQAENVFVVGHNPHMKELLEDLTGTVGDHFRNSAAAIIEIDAEKWTELIHRKKGKLQRMLDNLY